MQKACLDFDWKCNQQVAVEASMGIVPRGGYLVDLPFCLYDSDAYLFKTVDLDQSYLKLELEIFGIKGIATLYINGQRVGAVTGAYSVVDIKKYSRLGQNVIMIYLQNAYGHAAVSGGINLLCTTGVVHVQNNGIFVGTRFCSPSVAFLHCEVDLEFLSESSLQPLLECDILVEIFNYRGKRVSKRLKKVKIRKYSKIEFKKIKINKPLLYSDSTPNLYKVVVSVLQNGNIVDTGSSIFGIRTFGLRKKKFALNNRLLWLNGLKHVHSNGVMEQVSAYALERSRLDKIKSYGFNAVSVQGLPDPSFLDACDRIGMLVMVELVNGFFDGNSFESFVFDREHQRILADYVKILRNHPSVIIYSIADGNSYTYGRNDGINFARNVLDIIKSIDTTRPITGAVAELVPTIDEMETYSSYGVLDNVSGAKDIVKVAQLISKDSDIFRNATHEFCKLLDFVSYKDLSNRYKRDLDLFDDRQILGVSTPIDRLEKLDIDELEFRANILGDFCDGVGFDIFKNNQPQYIYRQILFGAEKKSAICSYQGVNNTSISLGQASWDYPSFMGETVQVDVFSSGDVVALYLNEHLVGRNLAGRLHNYRTRFDVEYSPGTLQAVSFLKGHEHCITEISSVGFPYAVSLIASQKQLNLFDRRDLVFIEIQIVDNKGHIVDFATRDILISVSPECKIVAYGNQDPKFLPRKFDSNELVLPVYDGKAQFVLKGNIEGKANIVATSDGLKSGKLKLTVKTQLPKVGRNVPKF
ncbi:MAG: DUF4982 domain-containing protein [Firmicutes bacterium]|nr:DUF4982 domain-containing protein [Bacillota bacterium]MCL1953727.1 DUF4982 domain-containing protein [Bacillota bacterium]